jgi:colicin import membrane protein
MAKVLATPSESPATDPFFWGSRWLAVDGVDGTRELKEVPLTREDVLDPQEGDMMVHGQLHGEMVRRLAVLLENEFRLQGRAMTVLDDVKMRWGIPGVKEPAPDLAILPFARNVQEHSFGGYSVGVEGPLPCLVIEVTSPHYRTIDLEDKVEIYCRAGIREYLILDILATPIALIGYRLTAAGRYRRNASRARFFSQSTGLRFLRGRDLGELVVEDAASGRRLLWPHEEARARSLAEQRWLQEAEMRAAAEAELEALRRKLESSS